MRAKQNFLLTENSSRVNTDKHIQHGHHVDLQGKESLVQLDRKGGVKGQPCFYTQGNRGYGAMLVGEKMQATQWGEDRGCISAGNPGEADGTTGGYRGRERNDKHKTNNTHKHVHVHTHIHKPFQTLTALAQNACTWLFILVWMETSPFQKPYTL